MWKRFFGIFFFGILTFPAFADSHLNCPQVIKIAGRLLEERVVNLSNLKRGEIYFIPGRGKLVFDRLDAVSSKLHFDYYEPNSHNNRKSQAVISVDQIIYPADSVTARLKIEEEIERLYDARQLARNLLQAGKKNQALLNWIKMKGANPDPSVTDQSSLALAYFQETGIDLLREALLDFFEREKTSAARIENFGLRLPWPGEPSVSDRGGDSASVPYRLLQLPYHVDEYLRTKIFKQGIKFLYPEATTKKSNSFTVSEYIPSRFPEHSSHLATKQMDEFKAKPSLEGAKAMLKPFREKLLLQYSGRVDMIFNMPPTSDSPATQFLAEAMAEILAVPYIKAVVKKDGPAQRNQPTLMERLSNISNSFLFSRDRRIKIADLKTKKVLIVDDIITSGATGAEIQRFLYGKGFVDTQIFAFAQTMEPSALPSGAFELASDQQHSQWQEWDQAIGRNQFRDFITPDFFTRFKEMKGLSASQGVALLERLISVGLAASVVSILDSTETLDLFSSQDRLTTSDDLQKNWKRLMVAALEKSPYLKETLSPESAALLKP